METTEVTAGEKAATGDERRRPTGKWAELTLIPYFLALIAFVPAVQLVAELSRGESVQELDVFRQFPTVERLKIYERAVEDNSIVAEAVRKQCQWLSLVALRAGNQQAVVGREGTLFYRPSLDSVIGPHFMSDPHGEGHPVPAVVAFRDALRRHGVDLVLLVVPGKETIYPEWLSGRYPASEGPATIPDMPDFLAEMHRQGIRVVDPTDLLWDAKAGAEMYLRHDTHWTPEGLNIVAGELARHVEGVGVERRKLAAELLRMTAPGDLYDMLQLADLPSPFKPQTVTIRRVIHTDTGDPVEPDLASPVVLLGDSFTNIYSVADMGWGDHAGLGEQLALRLGQAIDIIALNDGGVNTARGTLARRPSALEGKKLVIWQFAARDLVVSNGEWQRIDIAD